MMTALLALLGVGAIAALMDVFDSDSDVSEPSPIGEEDEFPPIEEDNNASEPIEIEDQQTVLGTDGDDSILGGPTAGSPNLIDAGLGADTINIEGGIAAHNTQIEGGPGDDVVTVAGGFYTTINGGEGDDTLSVLNSSNDLIDGGTGDDMINFSQNFNSSSSDGSSFIAGGNPSLVFGGEGSDTFSVVAGTDPRVAGPILIGGSDANAGGDGDSDRYLIDVTTTDFGFNTIPEELLFEFDAFGNVIGEVENPVVTSTIATITDFEPGVDHLEIDLRDTHDIDPDAHSLSSVETEETAEGTAVRMTFDAVRPEDPEGTYELVATIFLADTFGVDANRDITILT